MFGATCTSFIQKKYHLSAISMFLGRPGRLKKIFELETGSDIILHAIQFISL
jgi:hypothetical protein